MDLGCLGRLVAYATLLCFCECAWNVFDFNAKTIIWLWWGESFFYSRVKLVDAVLCDISIGPKVGGSAIIKSTNVYVFVCCGGARPKRLVIWIWSMRLSKCCGPALLLMIWGCSRGAYKLGLNRTSTFMSNLLHFAIRLSFASTLFFLQNTTQH